MAFKVVLSLFLTILVLVLSKRTFEPDRLSVFFLVGVQIRLKIHFPLGYIHESCLQKQQQNGYQREMQNQSLYEVSFDF
jgi:hypothetical protein